MNNLMLMVLKKLGLPLSVSTFMGILWDAAIHLIKTLYGTSDVSYGSTKETPLYGPGQGSMCGSLFWLLCYWLIVESLDKNITALKFISVCKEVVVENHGCVICSRYWFGSHIYIFPRLTFVGRPTI
jgi:hypothetical protein